MPSKFKSSHKFLSKPFRVVRKFTTNSGKACLQSVRKNWHIDMAPTSFQALRNSFAIDIAKLVFPLCSLSNIYGKLIAYIVRWQKTTLPPIWTEIALQQNENINFRISYIEILPVFTTQTLKIKNGILLTAQLSFIALGIYGKAHCYVFSFSQSEITSRVYL